LSRFLPVTAIAFSTFAGTAQAASTDAGALNFGLDERSPKASDEKPPQFVADVSAKPDVTPKDSELAPEPRTEAGEDGAIAPPSSFNTEPFSAPGLETPAEAPSLTADPPATPAADRTPEDRLSHYNSEFLNGDRTPSPQDVSSTDNSDTGNGDPASVSQSHPPAPKLDQTPSRQPLGLNFDPTPSSHANSPLPFDATPPTEGNSLSPTPNAWTWADSSPIDPLFVGGSNSLVARAVGHAEGTRTTNGDKTWAYYGHIDPGNGVWNLGTFSYQHGARSPEEADTKQLQRLYTQAQELQAQAQKQNMTLDQTELLNALDLANQAPLAALDRGYIDRLHQAKAMGLSGSEAVLWARVRSFIDPDTGLWNAPGLGNSLHSITDDQQRRMLAIAQVLQSSDMIQTADHSSVQSQDSLSNAAAIAGQVIHFNL
jgi:hypothetical protein